MPLTAATLEPLMIGEFAASGLAGAFSIPLISALSQGIATTIITAQVVTNDIGILGVGVGIGSVVGVTPALLTPSIIGFMTAEALAGPFSIPMATAVSNAFCTWFLTGIVQTTNPLVGIGTGIGQILGLVPTAMQGAIVGMMVSNGIAGPMSPMLAGAISEGICTTVMTGQAIVVITGSPVPPVPPTPGSGIGNGILM